MDARTEPVRTQILVIEDDPHIQKILQRVFREELMAPVQPALRRPRMHVATNAVFSFGDCEVDFAEMSARRSGKPVILAAHEFKLLRYFVENAERVLSREELLSEVWGYKSYPTTRTVDNQILKLRQKLETISPHVTQLAAETISGAEPASAIHATLEEIQQREAVEEFEIATHDVTKVETESKYPLNASGLLLSFGDDCGVDRTCDAVLRTR